MTTFKDLLSKDLQNELKQMSGNKTKASHADEKGEQTTALPSKKHIEKQVKRFDSELVGEDMVLFMQAMHGVKPLKHEKSVVQKVNKTDDNALYRRANAQGGEDFSDVALSDMQALLNPVAGEAFLSYKQPSLQNKVFEQLKQGKLRWYDAVDLHGSSIEDARNAVLKLVRIASQNGETVVKIVHGKGADAIIKTCVNGWLRQMPQVMAFVSAPSNEGGNGAVLVLLKKNKAQPTA
ncbi:DNA mismatch repair protein MutS [Moraxella caviae]|uniref:DNA mismatch repair protein MutS n=1 Tax=Moraxella caviae TaxID=34060 RepID=A0A1T0A2E0_9GAMM|nr:Smr/MutS family protein [Moraxella caviae]OOR89926.1 DNA mismatch repair protein MutS [Moraxella caviae]STZ14310.1 Probable DNA endonuclease SmrA [Moraxella caviae]